MTDPRAAARKLPKAPKAISRWARLGTFTPRDWFDLSEAAWTLAVAHVALRLASPARVTERATLVRRSRHRTFTDARLVRVAWLVGVAGRYLVPVPCLSRSVGLARVLARRGIVTEIRVGVRTHHGELDAHAWVEWKGQPLNDDEANVGRYAPFARPLGEVAKFQSEIR